jgi:UPF0176 protein
LNEACHLLFIQCENCAHQFGGCCSEDCHAVTLLSEEEQKEIRKAKTISNKIFKKGKSPVLKYKIARD